MKLVFDVVHVGEPGAGLPPYRDRVEVAVASGDPGGGAGEFQEHLRVAVAEWFDGARVVLLADDDGLDDLDPEEPLDDDAPPYDPDFDPADAEDPEQAIDDINKLNEG